MESHSNSTAQKTFFIDRQLPQANAHWSDWRWQLRNSQSDINALGRMFSLSGETLHNLTAIIKEYPFSITPYYASLIDANDPHDPVALQCIPSLEEGKVYFENDNDPLGEEKDTAVPGLIHRYPDRVLITVTNMCPVYCRHCTRRRTWCQGNWVRTQGELQRIYAYIAAHPKVRDVILSGGDPFILSSERLDSILKNVRAIPHVEIIRIGTRCPVVLPQRIDDELLGVLKRYRPLWLNTHFNHPREITRESIEACDKIISSGIPVNNQTVLLRGINDAVPTMTELCQGLLKIGVRPYYLFQCDPVSGTGHFRTSIDKGLEIIKGMRGHTSGLCVPTYVVDGLQGQGKVPLQPDYLVAKEKNYFILRGYKGETFKYYNPEE